MRRNTSMEITREKSLPRSEAVGDDELAAFEREHAAGASSGEVVDFFERRGLRFSEATFRKYIQLGLLPRSQRVGTKGKHKGSHGVYPAGIVRQIREVKRMMALDYTIEEIRTQLAPGAGELPEIRQRLAAVLDRVEASLGHGELHDLALTGFRRQLEETREAANALFARIEELTRRLRNEARTRREAV